MSSLAWLSPLSQHFGEQLKFSFTIFVPLIGSSSRCGLKYSRMGTSDHCDPDGPRVDRQWPRVVWTTNERMALIRSFHYLLIMTTELPLKNFDFHECYGGCFHLFQCGVLPSYPLHLTSASPITVLKVVPIRHKPVITLKERERGVCWSDQIFVRISPWRVVVVVFIARDSLEKSVVNCLRSF